MESKWMRRRWIAAGAATAAGFAYCGWWGWRRSAEAAFAVKYAPYVTHMFRGEEGVEVVRRPNRVRVQRVTHERPDLQSLEDLKPISPWLDVPPEDAAAFADALLSPFTYDMMIMRDWPREIAKSCSPQFGVRLSFERGGLRRDVLLCFRCALLLIFTEASHITSSGGDFDYGAPALARPLKKLFPADEEIQQLSVTTSRRPRLSRGGFW